MRTPTGQVKRKRSPLVRTRDLGDMDFEVADRGSFCFQGGLDVGVAESRIQGKLCQSESSGGFRVSA